MGAIRWCPEAGSGGGSARGGRAAQPTLTWLVAMEASSLRTHIFDAARSTASVPRRAAPIATLEPPASSPAAGGLRALPRLAFDSGGGAPAATGADAEAAAPLGVWLLVSDGEALGGVRLGDEREPREPLP